MSFNPDVSKQALEVLFSHKKNINNHTVVFFNNLPTNRESTQKHLGLLLDEKLHFSENVNEKFPKYQSITKVESYFTVLRRYDTIKTCQ